jgi:hypothetical protein
MAYSSIVKPTDYFNTNIWTGNGSSQSITGVGFQPDFIWFKNRDNGTRYHVLFDVVRGTNKVIYSNDTAAEATTTTQLTSFDSDGFSISSDANVNENTSGIVAWNWLGANGTASNSDGSITSTVSVNTTAGFSIVSYTGNASSPQTVGHSLGVTPDVIIFKCRETATDWTTFHTSLGGANKNLSLNSNSAAGTDTDFFANTNPTSSVFSVGAASNTNRSSEGMIAYCFAEKKGFSKFGSYNGNGSTDGPFIYTGFKPSFYLWKRTDSTSNWFIVDNKRDAFNETDVGLFPDSSAAESIGNGYNGVDFLSNGVKVRQGNSSINNSSGTYIYMAFAENPFVANDSGTAVPVVAR